MLRLNTHISCLTKLHPVSKVHHTLEYDALSMAFTKLKDSPSTSRK